MIAWRKGRFCRFPYNGWTAEERRATVPIQLAAFRSGIISRPHRCSICGFDDIERSSDVLLHLERYDTPLLGYGCCRRCHAVLHARFDNPRRWMRLLEQVAANDCWAYRLTLDPASLTTPFEVTYPDDLPVDEAEIRRGICSGST